MPSDVYLKITDLAGSSPEWFINAGGIPPNSATNLIVLELSPGIEIGSLNVVATNLPSSGSLTLYVTGII